jgi:GntR family transcriptional regulator
MRIIIQNRSGTPIYQQIVDQVRLAIISGELSDGTALPSIRSLAKELRISVITTTRAYHDLEQAGFVQNIQGKGTYVQPQDSQLIRENALRQVEDGLQSALDAAKIGRIELETLHTMLDTLNDAGDEKDG